jgi:hypothetical protein
MNALHKPILFRRRADPPMAEATLLEKPQKFLKDGEKIDKG